MKLGVGVKFKQIGPHEILMKGGVTLHTLIVNDCLHSSFIPLILLNLMFMAQVMKSNKIAHCDIKPANVILEFQEDYFMLKFIDCDSVKNYGDLR